MNDSHSWTNLGIVSGDVVEGLLSLLLVLEVVLRDGVLVHDEQVAGVDLGVERPALDLDRGQRGLRLVVVGQQRADVDRHLG